MPFYLRESDALSRINGIQSALIVPCRFCPAASLAVRERKPYLELFRRFLRTEAYESFIQSVRTRLRKKGIRTAVFDSKLLHQFVACMWTVKRRRTLAERASRFDAVVVLGCDAMVEAVRQSMGRNGCQVIQGMEIEGLMNVTPTVRFPSSLLLELQGVASVGTRSESLDQATGGLSFHRRGQERPSEGGEMP